MPEEIRVPGTFLVAALVALALTPAARRIAVRMRFLDYPTGYKGHLRPIPYLGGVGLMAGFMLAAVGFAGNLGRFAPLTICALVLLIVGTLDDRLGLGVGSRLAVQVGVAATLWAAGTGWAMLPGELPDLALTIVWVVGLVNAFNLMDNLDGAAGTVGGTCAAGTAVLALIHGDAMLALLAAALAGACMGFLPYNLARPSRIFLGDGGSMPLGLIVAGTIMAIPNGELDWVVLLASAPLVGLPILDTTLVVLSRWRRGVQVLSGARDHLSHRLLSRLGTERRVAVALGAAQALLCALALALHQLDKPSVLTGSAVYLLAGLAVLAWLEAPQWRAAVGQPA